MNYIRKTQIKKSQSINLDSFKNHFLILNNNKLLTYELHKQTTKINKRLWQTSMSKFLHQVFVIKDFAIKKPSKLNTPKKNSGCTFVRVCLKAHSDVLVLT